MTKTITQHIPLYLIAVAYLIAVVTFILITVSSTATPTGTVNAYLDAIVAQNPQKIVTYETEDFSYLFGVEMTPVERIEFLEESFESVKSRSYTNRNLVVDAETETTATVSVSLDISITPGFPISK